MEQSPGPGAATVVAVARDGAHRFSKGTRDAITLLAGLGVEGDAHLGVTVQHRSRVARDPDQPNLRQVHLLPAEFLDGIAATGFDVAAGELGENVLTRGLDLLALPTGTLLAVGSEAVLRVTGLRNPCRQIDDFQPGLLRLAVGRSADGAVLRRGGIMAVVEHDGTLRPGDPVTVTLPPGPHVPLEAV